MTLPSEPRIRDVLRRTAELQHRLAQEIGDRPLVLPNGRFFPDRFTGDAPSALALLQRMQRHAAMTDIPLEVRILGGSTASKAERGSSTPTSCCGSKGSHEHSENDGAGNGPCKDCDGNCDCGGSKGACREKESEPHTASGSCSSGGCGSGCGVAVPADSMGDAPRLVDVGGSWRVQIPEAELTHPVALTTNLARTLGVVFLAETASPSHPVESPLDVSAEIAATLLGLGSLLLAGSYVYSKSCGGPRIAQITALTPGELALVTVLFAKRRGFDLRPLARELEATQRDALSNAREWLEERPKLVDRFIRAPESIAGGDIPMAPSRVGLFSRWFGKKSETSSNLDALDLGELEAEFVRAGAPKGKRTRPEPKPYEDELRALVDEALAQPGSTMK
jgi:hypothetical protein